MGNFLDESERKQKSRGRHESLELIEPSTSKDDGELYDIDVVEVSKIQDLYERVEEMGKCVHQLNTKEINKDARIIERYKLMKLNSKRHDGARTLINTHEILKVFVEGTSYKEDDYLISQIKDVIRNIHEKVGNILMKPFCFTFPHISSSTL